MRNISLGALLGLAAVTILSAAQPTLTTLYNFTDVGDPGDRPMSGPALGPGGVLYGTTTDFGSGGAAYSLTPPSTPEGSWTENTIHLFMGGSDGSGANALTVSSGPGGRVILYGTTYQGGAANLGTVYSLTAPSSPEGTWTEEVIYSFKGGRTDGSYAMAGVTMGADGTLYGTTGYGGSSNCNKGDGCGIVYSLTPPAVPGGVWTETVLHQFDGADGSTPLTAPVMGPGGVLYGVANMGGLEESACDHGQAQGCGTVYSMTPPSTPDGAWGFSVIFSFNGTTEGYTPYSLVIGADGTLYGSSWNNVFSLTPPASPGGDWTQTILRQYKVTRISGASPYLVAFGANGILYGFTGYGGKNEDGTIFSLTAPASPGGAWTQRILFTFTNETGAGPAGFAVGPGKHPVLYGATSYSATGSSDYGTVFSLEQ